MARTLSLQIEVPDDASEESLQLAERMAREVVVLFLQQQGELSIGAAAMALDLTYERYLDLLADRGLPAAGDDTDPTVVEMFERWLRQRDTHSS